MAPRRALRAVLFDAAGTLVHVRQPVGETYARLARDFGVALPAPAVDAAFRRTLRDMPPMVFPGAERMRAERDWWLRLVRQTIGSVDPHVRFTDFDAYFDALFRHYARGDAWSAAADAHDVLATLRARGQRTGVVSNFDHRLYGIFDELRLTPLFDVIVLPGDAGAAKPDPRIFARAIEELHVKAGEAAYVGDDAEHDIAGAEAAGLIAIDVRTLASLRDLIERVAPGARSV